MIAKCRLFGAHLKCIIVLLYARAEEQERSFENCILLRSRLLNAPFFNPALNKDSI